MYECIRYGRQRNDKEAWASIIQPTDIVGIKTNVWNKFPTPEIMNDLLKERILQVDVKEENVSINDRGIKVEIQGFNRWLGRRVFRVTQNVF